MWFSTSRTCRKHYEIETGGMFLAGEKKTVKANEALSFRAREAETVAIVGESGCGKSTFAKVLMGLESATDGHVTLDNVDSASWRSRSATQRRSRACRWCSRTRSTPSTPATRSATRSRGVIRKFGVETDREKIVARVNELLDIVKLPRDFAKRRPRQLSGGQKQRVGIARAFAGDPKVVIADEPVSALDVSVQAAVTGLLMDIQRENRTTLLFISHDLSVVRYLADRVVVMYLGRIMEKGTTDEIFAPPYHPYTEALLSRCRSPIPL